MIIVMCVSIYNWKCAPKYSIGCGGREGGSLGSLVVASAAYTSSYALKMGH